MTDSKGRPCCVPGSSQAVWMTAAIALLGLVGPADALLYRLTGTGSTSDFGRLEVRVNSSAPWTSVCDRGFGRDEAIVGCRSLGLPTANANAFSFERGDAASTLRGTGAVYPEQFNCGSSDSSLDACSTTSAHSSCTSSNDRDVVLSCSATGWTYRLQGGGSASFGRLEVRPNVAMPYGTVCSDRFDQREAEVACRALGLTITRPFYQRGQNFDASMLGGSSQPIYLDDLNCPASRTNLEGCGRKRDGHNCDHNDDIILACSSSPWNYRLTGTGSTSEYGRLEVQPHPSIAYGVVCRDGFQVEEAQVACRSLGLATTAVGFYAVRSGTGPASITGTSERILFDDVRCSGNEALLSDCTKAVGHNCDHDDDIILSCSASWGYRLTGPDATASYGRLEVRPAVPVPYGTVCDDSFGLNEARVACRSLGQPTTAAGRWSVAWATAPVSMQGTTGQTTLMDELGCDGSEPVLDNCSRSEQEDCDREDDIILSCTNQWEYRLAGANATAVYGRLEVRPHTAMSWGTVCNSGSINRQEIAMVCTTLGQSSGSVGIFSPGWNNAYDAMEGSSSQYVYMGEVDCDGSEGRVEYCSRTSSPGCGHDRDVVITCSTWEFRFAGPNVTSTFGRVETRPDTSLPWGTICDDTPGYSETRHNARLLCSKLGVASDGAAWLSPSLATAPSSMAGNSTQFIWMDEMSCDGSESSPEDCSRSRGNGGCDHDNDVTLSCTEWAYRLAGANATASFGRLEVQPNPALEHGTVCSNGFHRSDARVACRTLGQSTAAVGYFSTQRQTSRATWDGDASQLVFIRDAGCDGSETLLDRCDRATGGGCDHDRDVVLTCASSWDVRFAGPGANTSIGRVEVLPHPNFEWGTVCDNDFTLDSARVACKSLGQGTAGAAFFSENLNTARSTWAAGGSMLTLMSGVECSSGATETNLEECSRDGGHSCGHDRDVVVSCNPWSYRLNGTNATASFGRLEVLPHPTYEWGTVCVHGFGFGDARVACRSLGQPTTGASMFSTVQNTARSHMEAPSSELVLVERPTCGGGETLLEDCGRDPGTNCGHNRDVILTCSPWSYRMINATGGVVDVNNSTTKYGRIEGLPHPNYEWGTACDDDFDINDARVACRMLGFSTTHAAFFSENIGTSPQSMSGDSSQLVLLDNLGCSGSEAGLADCGRTTWVNCGHAKDIIVSCSPWEYRLAGDNATATMGRLEARPDPSAPWGTVSDDGFTSVTAKMACESLNLPTGSITFGSPRTRTAAPGMVGNSSQIVYIDGLSCAGSEGSLDRCTRRHRPTSGHDRDVVLSCGFGYRLAGERATNTTGVFQAMLNSTAAWENVTVTSTYNFTEYDAATACRSLGLSSLNAAFELVASGVANNTSSSNGTESQPLGGRNCNDSHWFLHDCPTANVSKSNTSSSSYVIQLECPNIGTVTSPFIGNATVSGEATGNVSQSALTSPSACAIDTHGHLLVASNHSVVYRGNVTAARGTIDVLMGDAMIAGTSDGNATTATLSGLYGIVANPDHPTETVVFINTASVRTAVTHDAVVEVNTRVGSNSAGYEEGGGNTARFTDLRGLCRHAATQNYYVTEYTGHRVRRIASVGGLPNTSSLLAGDVNSTAGLIDSVGPSARFNQPSGLTVSQDAEVVYVIDYGNKMIRTVSPAGVVSFHSGWDDPHAVVLAPGDRYLFVGDGQRVFRVNLPTLSREYVINSAATQDWTTPSSGVSTLAAVNWVLGMCVSIDGKFLYITGRHSVAQLFITEPRTTSRTLTLTVSLSVPPTRTVTFSSTVTLSQSVTVSRSVPATPTLSISTTSSVSRPTLSLTVTLSRSVSASRSQTQTISATSSASGTHSMTISASLSRSFSRTSTASIQPTETISESGDTPSQSTSPSPSASETQSLTISRFTASPSRTNSDLVTDTDSLSLTDSVSVSRTRSVSDSLDVTWYEPLILPIGDNALMYHELARRLFFSCDVVQMSDPALPTSHPPPATCFENDVTYCDLPTGTAAPQMEVLTWDDRWYWLDHPTRLNVTDDGHRFTVWFPPGTWRLIRISDYPADGNRSNIDMTLTQTFVEVLLNDSVVVEMKFPRECFREVLAFQTEAPWSAVNVSMAPPPPFKESLFIRTAKTTAVVTGGVAGALGSVGTAAQAARANFLLNLARCKDLFEELDPIDSPTGIAIGEERYKYHYGAAVANPLLIIAWVFVNGMVGIVWKLLRGSETSVVSGLAFARCPSASVFVWLLFVQPVTTSAAVVAGYGKGGAMIVGIFGVFFVTLLAVAAVMYFVKYFADQTTFNQLATNRVPKPTDNCIKRFGKGILRHLFARQGEWVAYATASINAVRHFGMLFDDYNGRAPWFAVVEVAMSMALGIVAAMTDIGSCQKDAIIALVVYFVYMVVGFYFNPFVRRFDMYFTLGLTILQFLGIIFIIVGESTNDPYMNLIAEQLAAMCMFLMIVRSFYEAGKTVNDVFCRERRRRAKLAAQMQQPLMMSGPGGDDDEGGEPRDDPFSVAKPQRGRGQTVVLVPPAGGGGGGGERHAAGDDVFGELDDDHDDHEKVLNLASQRIRHRGLSVYSSAGAGFGALDSDEDESKLTEEERIRRRSRFDLGEAGDAMAGDQFFGKYDEDDGGASGDDDDDAFFGTGRRRRGSSSAARRRFLSELINPGEEGYGRDKYFGQNDGGDGAGGDDDAAAKARRQRSLSQMWGDGEAPMSSPLARRRSIAAVAASRVQGDSGPGLDANELDELFAVESRANAADDGAFGALDGDGADGGQSGAATAEDLEDLL